MGISKQRLTLGKTSAKRSEILKTFPLHISKVILYTLVMFNIPKYFSEYELDRFSSLEGKILSACEADRNTVYFLTDSGEKYALHHFQNCCERVYIESIEGDLNDLIGTQILKAEQATNSGNYDGESHTWTFYKFTTVKGYVDIRFCGSSNGYYSESVDFIKIK